MEDSKIIDLFFERSEQAIIELSKKYGSICRRIAFNILKNDSDVEECVNDAYLKVWNTVPPGNPDSLMSYVCLAVRNTAIDRLKAAKAARRTETVDTDFDEILRHMEHSVDLDEVISEKEFDNVINDFLAQQKKCDRILFVRRYFCCEKIETLARFFGWSVSATSKKLLRMRDKLKIYLTEKGYTI